MEQQQSRQEDHEEMIEMNIKKFIAVARQYLLGMAPAPQPALVPVVARRVR
jgi:hypothetical protein